MKNEFIIGLTKQFEYYKLLGEKTIHQVPEDKLNWQYNEESNSIATIVHHMTGNMISRFTDFLTTDGEKEWRNRDKEFENEVMSKDALLVQWEKGWAVLTKVLHTLNEEDLNKTVYIRNMGQTVTDALTRQLAHYAYHVGQIVFLGKMIMNSSWQSLSIPRGESGIYNAAKFSAPKHDEHFADELLQKKEGSDANKKAGI